MHARFQTLPLCGVLAALATAHSTSTAEVNHQFVDIPVASNTTIDIDGNGIIDFEAYAHHHAQELSLQGADWTNAFLVANTTDGFSTIGDVVGPRPVDGYFASWLTIYSFGQWGSYFIATGDHLIGITFVRDGATHYGWIGTSVVANEFPGISATITDIAWESEPGQAVYVGWGDCNGNGLNDVYEILAGGDLPDCNGDFVSDDCQPDEDCNGNGVRDLCELGSAGVTDCNNNLIPDSCEIAADPSLDCNGDGVLDSCVVVSDDCDGNGLSDACEIALQPALDCDGDAILDVCQIADNPALDCDGNGKLDSCQRIMNPYSDCNGDGVLDACQPWFVDCDLDEVDDGCAIALGLVNDCNADGVPDTCQGAPFADDPSFLLLPGAGAGATIPGLLNVLPTSEITIELWQFIKNPGPAATFWTHLGDTNRCLVHAPFTDGKVYWDFGVNIIPNGRLAYTPPVAITGTWQHFAFQASNLGEFMRIYRNGVLEAEKAGAETFQHEGGSLKIGGTAWGSFEGRIDEVRIWNHVRTASEIAMYMNSTVDPATPGLVGYWRFDEGTGVLSDDLAGNLNAFMNGGAKWGQPLNCPPSADLNDDGFVNAADLAILLAAWGPARAGSDADITGDGTVDGADLAALLGIGVDCV